VIKRLCNRTGQVTQVRSDQVTQVLPYKGILEGSVILVGENAAPARVWVRICALGLVHRDDLELKAAEDLLDGDLGDPGDFLLFCPVKTGLVSTCLEIVPTKTLGGGSMAATCSRKPSVGADRSMNGIPQRPNTFALRDQSYVDLVTGCAASPR
jgi:hypothetical protein